MFSLGFCHCEQPVYLCAAISRQQVTQKMVANIRINLDIRVIWTIIYLRYHKISGLQDFGVIRFSTCF